MSITQYSNFICGKKRSIEMSPQQTNERTKKPNPSQNKNKNKKQKTKTKTKNKNGNKAINQFIYQPGKSLLTWTVLYTQKVACALTKQHNTGINM